MKKNHTISKFTFLLCAVACLALFVCSPTICRVWAQAPAIKIGVLAIRGRQQCLDNWSLTADYLTATVSGARFVIVPLTHEKIYSEVEKGEVDFILANSALYVEMEHWY